MRIQFKIALLLFILTACNQQIKDKSSNTSDDSKPQQEEVLRKASMSNPVLMSGTNIGKLFNAYYRTGQVEQLLIYSDKHTIEEFGIDKLSKFYKNLDYGYDMELSGLRQEGNFKLLTYTCRINATKVIKQLRVVIEDDTARIVPFNPELDLIFE
ncbi:MAG: hypothetical protein NWR50_05555 [Crocinitomicaceae bacterium]|nr:hypothetical protein [Crocinitomicaceae bacterium]